MRFPWGSTGGPERILKIDLSTNTTKEIFFNQDDYKTKQIHIVDDRLVVVGGSFVNTYDLNLTADPISTSHGKRLSSFGTAILDDDIYIIGGDLTQVESDRIFKWDLNTNSLTEFETLLEPRFGARATIVNDTMYVFGGSETPFGEAENTIYEIPMNDPFNIGTFRMDLPAKFSFVQQFENTIFIAASMEQRAENGYLLYRESTIGIFDTHYNTYKEIETNLDNSSGLNTIYQMCILDNKMYIIYGNKEVNSSGPCNEWEVMVSELN